MRASRSEMAESHGRIIEAASRLFRRSGIESASVAEVMRAAGLTHGGFYRHFENKQGLVSAALEAAFREMADRLAAVAEGAVGEGRLERQRASYLSEEHAAHPELGCPAAALGPEVARGESALQATFGDGVRLMAEALGSSFEGDPSERRARALRELATWVGALVLARASDPATAAEVLEVARGASSAALTPSAGGPRRSGGPSRRRPAPR